MEADVVRAEQVLPNYYSFKKVQIYDKYPNAQPRGRRNFHNYPLDLLNYVCLESPPPPLHPCNRTCDITGFHAPYYDPRTKLRYAGTDVFKIVKSLPNDYVQRYLALRNAAVVLK